MNHIICIVRQHLDAGCPIDLLQVETDEKQAGPLQLPLETLVSTAAPPGDKAPLNMLSVPKDVLEMIDYQENSQPPRISETAPEIFQVFVRNLKGKSLTIETHGDMKVAEFKQIVERKNGGRAEFQRLLSRGRILDDEQSIGQYGLTKLVTIDLVIRLRGGPAREEVEAEEETIATVAAINMRKGLMGKLDPLLDACDEHAIDFALVSEIGEGARPFTICKKRGYKYIQSEMLNAGVAMLMRKDLIQGGVQSAELQCKWGES
jgi:hypothetical protein